MSENIAMTLTIEFLSDWRVGSGAGAVLADRAVQRDAVGLPRVPGQSIVGIWRDACEAIAVGLDDLRPGGDWQQRVHLLFGDQPARRSSEQRPRPALLDVRHATLPSQLREALSHPERAPLRDALTHMRASTSIDEYGAATPDHLRFEEAARRGMTLEAPVLLRLQSGRQARSHGSSEQLLALLAAGAAYVDRLGAARRRGLGRCIWRLPLDPQEVLTVLAGGQRRLSVPPRDPPADATPPDSGTSDLRLRIRLESDVVVGESVLGNSVRSRSRVPGAMLLAHVAAAVDAACGPGAAARAIQAAELTLTDATPELAGAPAGPLPYTFARYRNQPTGGEFEVVNAWLGDRDPSRQTKALRSGFCGTADADAPTPYQPPSTSVRTHGVVEDELQRPDESGVYTYEALPERSVLACEARFDGDLAAALARPRAYERLAQAMSGRVRIGRGSHAGYGAAEVSIVPTPAAAAQAVRAPIGDNPSALIVWLTSDLLWEDESLEQATGPAAVRDAVAWALSPFGYHEPLQIGRHATRTARREGWVTAWGLPRPSCIGVAAGSVIELLTTSGRPTEDQLSAIERAGAGLRRAEGFGQLRLDDPLTTRAQITLRTSQPVKESEQMTLLDDPSRLAEGLQLTAWRREIARLAVLISEKPSQRRAALSLNDGHALSPSQLGALRQVARTLRDDQDAGRRWLQAMRNPDDGVKERAKPWFDAWSDDGAAIGELLSPSPRVWTLLQDLPGSESALASPLRLTICGSPEEMRSCLWSDATAALVDACARAESQEARG